MSEAIRWIVFAAVVLLAVMALAYVLARRNKRRRHAHLVAVVSEHWTNWRIEEGEDWLYCECGERFPDPRAWASHTLAAGQADRSVLSTPESKRAQGDLTDA